MKVALYGQFYHKNSGKYIRELLDELSNLDIEVRMKKMDPLQVGRPKCSE